MHPGSLAELHDMTEESSEMPGKPRSWFARVRSGLARSSRGLSEGISGIFTKRRLDESMLSDLEDLLITTDLGVETAREVTMALRRDRFDKEISAEEVRAALAAEVTKVLAPVAIPLDVTGGGPPFVILVVGVNGTGKTTTIGKLAAQIKADGKSVMLAAGDTFRAAAIEQLSIWADRAGVPIVTTKEAGDPAGLAFDAIEKARAENIDVLMIDTAGRLQNKTDLMDELAKIRRVIAKLDDTAPHATLLVLDATTGQNAINQVEVFQKVANVTGLVMTKLDGTARGGILVSVARKFGLPVHAIGVGEGIDDLRPFDPEAFAAALCATVSGEDG